MDWIPGTVGSFQCAHCWLGILSLFFPPFSFLFPFQLSSCLSSIFWISFYQDALQKYSNYILWTNYNKQLPEGRGEWQKWTHSGRKSTLRRREQLWVSFQFRASGLRTVFSFHLAKQEAHHWKALLDGIPTCRGDSTQITKQKNIKTSLNFEVLPKKNNNKNRICSSSPIILMAS